MKIEPQKCERRWTNYSVYKLILWMWMINETSIVFTPVEVSHTGFYVNVILYTLSVLIIGIPLVYTEICLVQYTNLDTIDIWNFFPLFKGFGWTTIYLMLLKIIYTNIVCSWYFIFTYYAAYDPPPWYSCEGFKDTNCMVKRINISTFQHCIEAQTLFNVDCGMKTASKCFFEREIASHTTKQRNCYYQWKPILAMCVTKLVIIVLCIKKQKLYVPLLKMLAVCFGIVMFILLSVSLSTNGTWFASKVIIKWENFNFSIAFRMIVNGSICCGTGYGIIGFLTRDVYFRSPATMTSISVPLLSILSTIIAGLILFNGIKTMSYFHGEEENVLEISECIFFNLFASVVEILSYFTNATLWSFLWFITIYTCLLVNNWILHLFLLHSISKYCVFSHKRPVLYSWLLVVGLFILSFPFCCYDLTEVLKDITELFQIFNSFAFSLGIYWIYGFKNHIVDITFMIGIKSGYIWKILWIINPILLLFVLYYKIYSVFITTRSGDSFYIPSLSIALNEFVLWALVCMYFFILFISTTFVIYHYIFNRQIKNIFLPTADWGPMDTVLFKSRKMFIPEIMTREFLYRQVKIHGYTKNKSASHKRRNKSKLEQLITEKLEWNALTSN